MRLRCKIFFTLAGLKFGNSAKGRTAHCCLMVGSFDCVSTESGEVQTLQARRLWVARAHSCHAEDMGVLGLMFVAEILVFVALFFVAVL